MEKKKSNEYANRSFEENLTKLEEIVSKMERHDVSLDEAIKLYEEGLNLSIYLNDVLTKYEGKIKILDKNFEEGKISEKELEEKVKEELDKEMLEDDEEEIVNKETKDENQNKEEDAKKNKKEKNNKNKINKDLEKDEFELKENEEKEDNENDQLFF